MKLRFLTAACIGLCFAHPARAGLHAEALGSCVVGATTQADRTALMRWMFVAIAGNPAFADITSITAAQRQAATEAAAAVFDRLLLRTCRRESMLAMRHEGNAGIEAGFRALGLFAGRELMASEASMAALDQLVNAMDVEGMEELSREAQAAASPRI